MGAGLDVVEGGAVPGKLSLHFGMNAIEISLGHEALADTLLIGDEDERISAGFAQAETFDDAGRKVKILPPQHIAAARRHIHHTIAVKKDSRPAHEDATAAGMGGGVGNDGGRAWGWLATAKGEAAASWLDASAAGCSGSCGQTG